MNLKKKFTNAFETVVFFILFFLNREKALERRAVFKFFNYMRGDINPKILEEDLPKIEEGFEIGKYVDGQFKVTLAGIIADDIKDLKKAEYWAKKALLDKNPETVAYAQFTIGKIYFEKNLFTESANWMKKAAKLGHAEAMTYLAARYSDGKGLAKNDEKAFFWTEKAAERGNQRSQVHLVGCLFVGLGTDENIPKAKELMAKYMDEENPHVMLFAAELAFGSKINKVDESLLSEWNVEENLDLAFELLLKVLKIATENGNEDEDLLLDVSTNLGLFYKMGWGTEKDLKKSFFYTKYGADRGIPEAQLNLAIHYANGLGCEKDNKIENQLLMSASEQGNMIAQHNLAGNYFEGIGIEKNVDIASYWLEKSASQGFYDAQIKFASWLDTGVIDRENHLEEAIKWQEKAISSKQDADNFNNMGAYLAQYWISLADPEKKKKKNLIIRSLKFFSESIIMAKEKKNFETLEMAEANLKDTQAILRLSKRELEKLLSVEVIKTRYDETKLKESNVLQFPNTGKLNTDFLLKKEKFAISPDIDNEVLDFYGIPRASVLANPNLLRQTKVKDIILKRENLALEFKASFRTPYPEYPEPKNKNGKQVFVMHGSSMQREFNSITELQKELEESSLKSIVGFLNSSGGTLYIGILEDKESGENKFVGINREEVKKGKRFLDNDDYERYINQQIQTRIGTRYLGEYIVIDFIKEKDDFLCSITCKAFYPRKGEDPVLLDEEKCFRRSGPRTDELKGRKLVTFVSNRQLEIT